MRGTFANVRIKNLMLPPATAPKAASLCTSLIKSREQMPIYDAAMHYIADGTPTVVFGGEEYGTGSSRDWAAKGTQLLGVKAVITRSFERIHRSNLVGMGVLPLQFLGSDCAARSASRATRDRVLGLDDIRPQQELTLEIKRKRRHETADQGQVADRHPDRGRLLQARRHPALRAAGDPAGGVSGRTTRGSCMRRTTYRLSCFDGSRLPFRLRSVRYE